MIRLLSRLGDAMYVIFVCGILGGFAWAAWTHAAEYLPTLEPRVPLVLAQTCVALGVLSLCWFLEIVLPLRGLSTTRWIYVDRPRGRLRGFDATSWLQVAGVTALTLMLCAAAGLPLWLSFLAPLARTLIGWRHFTLASLLRAGRTRLVGRSGLTLLDSELVSDAIAAHTLRFRPRPATRLTLALVLRRLQRRRYILLGAVTVIALTTALSHQLGVLALGGFVCAWSACGAAVGRAASFGRILDDSLHDWGLPLGATAAMALLGGSVVLAMWTVPVLVVLLVTLTCWYIAFVRSRPARVSQMSLFDTGGFGVSFSPEVVGYFLRGGSGVVALATGLALLLT